MEYILTGVLGFFIGISVCFFLVVKPLFNTEKEDSKPSPTSNQVKVDIKVGDTVWYQGEKWSVYIHDYSCDSSLSEIHKYHLFNGHKYIINVSLGEIKKVFRADSYTTHAT